MDVGTYVRTDDDSFLQLLARKCYVLFSYCSFKQLLTYVTRSVFSAEIVPLPFPPSLFESLKHHFSLEETCAREDRLTSI